MASCFIRCIATCTRNKQSQIIVDIFPPYKLHTSLLTVQRLLFGVRTQGCGVYGLKSGETKRFANSAVTVVSLTSQLPSVCTVGQQSSKDIQDPEPAIQAVLCLVVPLSTSQ